MSFWAVAQTVALHEDAVADRLDRIGYETLAPKGRFRVNGHLKTIAIFPGYVFLRIVDQWYDARWTFGVLRLIMSGEYPARLPEAEVDKIVRETGKDGLVRIPKKPRVIPAELQIASGAIVRILTGSFCGFYGIYQGMSARERQTVLLDLFGRRTPVELAADDRLAHIVDTAQNAPCGNGRSALAERCAAR